MSSDPSSCSSSVLTFVLQKVKIAIYASLYSNFILCAIQREDICCSPRYTETHTQLVYAAISSGSLSLLATAIDSVFDIGANGLLFWLHRKASSMDVNRWPVGGSRLETIGNVIYGRFMILLLTQLNN